MIGVTPLSAFYDALRRKKLSHVEQIRRLLKRRGKHGATNRELAEITHKFSSRISELRQEGHYIECERVHHGLTRYVMRRDES